MRTSNYVRLGGLCFFVLIGCVITAIWLGVAGSTDGPRFTIVVLIGVAMMFCISILRIFDEERTEKRQFSNGEEQEARVPSGKRARRRQQRFINFVAPQLRANEQTSVILSLAHEKVNALRLVGPEVAVVLTNQRVFEIRLQGIAARPNTTRATYARDSVTAEWTRNAYEVGNLGYGGRKLGKLSITGSFGTKNLWVEGEREEVCAEAIARALDADRAK